MQREFADLERIANANLDSFARSNVNINGLFMLAIYATHMREQVSGVRVALERLGQAIDGCRAELARVAMRDYNAVALIVALIALVVAML